VRGGGDEERCDGAVVGGGGAFEHGEIKLSKCAREMLTYSCVKFARSCCPSLGRGIGLMSEAVHVSMFWV